MPGTRIIDATGLYYAVATDSFLSGWGDARGGKSYYAVACDSWDEVDDVMQRMDTRSDFKRVRSSSLPPRTGSNDHLHVVPFSEFTYGQEPTP